MSKSVSQSSTKVAVITGASKGIGAAAAQRFLDAQYRVINLSRSSNPDSRVRSISTDLASADFVQPLHDALLPELDHAESICLVHNAALYTRDTVENLQAAALATIFQVNVIASLQLNQMLLPLMKRGSSILYVGSTLSEKAVGGCAGYVTTKHATAGLMRATCQDLVGRDIHTACICPGFTETEMLMSHLQTDEVKQQIASMLSFNRLVQPDEIAEVLYFASQNPAMNGSMLHANLGMIER
jgi:NAD(P)-dependent dehydrogenase (short-subunit alcohol dehydrogenase family)